METLDFWNIKKQQKQLQDCDENEAVISLGLFMNADKFRIGDTDYIEKPSEKTLNDHTLNASKMVHLTKNTLVVARDIIDSRLTLTIDDLVVKTMIEQQKQLEKQERQLRKAKSKCVDMHVVFELYHDRSCSKKETIKDLENEFSTLYDIIND